jgi:hypothetical protein
VKYMFEYIFSNANAAFIFINTRLPLKQNSQKAPCGKGYITEGQRISFRLTWLIKVSPSDSS